MHAVNLIGLTGKVLEATCLHAFGHRNPAVQPYNALASGVSGLETKNGGKTQSYALLVADTVVVKAGGAAPEILTNACTKGWSDVAYFFKVGLIDFPCCLVALAWMSSRQHFKDAPPETSKKG